MVKIYTDGSCSKNPGPGGWAVAIFSSDNFRTNGGYDINTTNNRMELKAFIEALKMILEYKDKKEQFKLFADSSYVVNAINNNWLENWERNSWKTKTGDNVKNKEQWQEVSELMKTIKSKRIHLTITKVKGHSGDTFNDIVDRIAKSNTLLAKQELEKQK